MDAINGAVSVMPYPPMPKDEDTGGGLSGGVGNGDGRGSAVDGVWDAAGSGSGSGDLSLDEGHQHSATQPVTSGSGGGFRGGPLLDSVCHLSGLQPITNGGGSGGNISTSSAGVREAGFGLGRETGTRSVGHLERAAAYPYTPAELDSMSIQRWCNNDQDADKDEAGTRGGVRVEDEDEEGLLVEGGDDAKDIARQLIAPSAPDCVPHVHPARKAASRRPPSSVFDAVRVISMRAGAVLALSDRVLHCSGPNATRHARRAWMPQVP